MADNQETITDIIAAKRQEADFIVQTAESYAKAGETTAGMPYDDCDLEQDRDRADGLRREADRLEAARKLEFSELRNALAELVASIEVRFPVIEYAIDRKPYLDAKKILEKTKEDTTMTNESIADIISEMRFHGQQNIDAEKDKTEYGILTVEGRIAQNYADRLEAANKRDVDKLNSAIQETVGRSDAEIDRLRREIAEMRQVGDAAKLPDGWKMYDKYQIRHTDGTPLKGKRYFVLRLDSDNPVEAARVAAAMRAYKSELRNCDVGTAEEQTKRYRKFCSAHQYLSSDFSYICKGFGKGRCPFSSSHAKSQCEFAWAQMPYEEGGSK